MAKSPHRYTDLTLAVEREPEAVPLTVYARRYIAWGPYGVECTIIGESHTVTVTRDGHQVFRELLACVDIRETSDVVRNEFTHATPGTRYRFTTTEGGYRTEITFSRELPEWAGGDPATTVRFAFPRYDGEVDPPYTELQWESGEETLSWRTIHVYDGGGAHVYVTSLSLLRRSYLEGNNDGKA